MGLVDRIKRIGLTLALAGAATYLSWVNLNPALQSKPKPWPWASIDRIREQNSHLKLSDIAVSPDRKRVAFAGYALDSQNKSHDIYVHDTESNTLENITQSSFHEIHPEWLNNDELKFMNMNGLDELWHDTDSGKSGKVPDKRTSGALFFGSVLAAAAGALAGLALLKKRKKRPLLEHLVQHPGQVAATSFLATTAACAANDPVMQYYPEILQGARGSYLFFCSTVPLAAGYWLNLPVHLNPPYGRNFLKHLRLAWKFRKKENRKNALESMRLIARQPSKYDFARAEFAFSQDQMEEGLEYLQRGLKNIDSVVDTLDIAQPLLWRAADWWYSRKEKTTATAFSRAYISLQRFDFPSMLQHLNDFVGEPVDPSRAAARALYVQSLKDAWPSFTRVALKHTHTFEQQFPLGALTDLYWKDAINAVLSDPALEEKFTPMGESRNEVMEYDASKFIQGLLVFKRCDIKDRERLIRERENILAFRKLYGNEIIESLAYVEHEGKAYHVLRHEAGKTLDDILKGTLGYEHAAKSWADSARLLARIHKADMPWESPEISEDYYSKRLATVCYDQLAASAPKIKVSQELRAELEQVGMRVYTGLKDAPLGWYKDANWRNWLRNEIQIPGYSSPNLAVIAIDFEHRIRLPVQLDLVSLRESGYAPELEKDLVLNNYFVTFGKPKNRDRFMHQYDWAGLQRHLEFAGYRARDKEYEAARFHIAQARHYAIEVGETSLAAMLGKSEHISIT